MKTFHIDVGIACALMCFGTQPAGAAVDGRSQVVIRQSAAAMGLSALKRVKTMRVDGNVSSLGLSGTGTQWLGISSGRFAESVSLPPLMQSDGYDGMDCWNRDNTGLVWNDGSQAGRSAEISNAFMSTYRLWKPGADGATVKSL
ncbi:MAG TPA: hypothetical protein VFE17_05085, partial [Candidatus Baltobacteraceae bacterium]|nr:hypothetical protein [Candidatus Baltobacteraceae bacterium]